MVIQSSTWTELNRIFGQSNKINTSTYLTNENITGGIQGLCGWRSHDAGDKSSKVPNEKLHNSQVIAHRHKTTEEDDDRENLNSNREFNKVLLQGSAIIKYHKCLWILLQYENNHMYMYLLIMIYNFKEETVSFNICSNSKVVSIS